MQIKRTSLVSFVAGAGSVVLLGAALVPSLVAAQTSDEAPSTGTAATESVEGIECGPGLFGLSGPLGSVGVPGLAFAGGLHLGEDLAELLGVTVEDLQAAAETVRESIGEIERPVTAEELVALKAELQSAFAAALGITVDDLESATEQLRVEQQAKAIARVNEMLADGTITQEQADSILERIESGQPVFGGHPGPVFRQFRGSGGAGRLGDLRDLRDLGGFGAFGGFGGFGGDEVPVQVTPDA